MANQVPPDLWSSEAVAKLGDSARMLLLYLLTGAEASNAGLPGLVTIGLAGLAESLGRDAHAVQTWLDELREAKLIFTDFRARLVRIVVGLLPPGNPNVVRGWYRRWKDLPNSQLKLDHLETLYGLVHGGDRADSTVTTYDQLFGPLGNGSGTVTKRFDPKSEQVVQPNLFQEQENASKAIASVSGADLRKLHSSVFQGSNDQNHQEGQSSVRHAEHCSGTVVEPFPNSRVRIRDRDRDRDLFDQSGSSPRARSPGPVPVVEPADEEEPGAATVLHEHAAALYDEQERLRSELALAPMPFQPEAVMGALAQYTIEQLRHALSVFAADAERDPDKARFFDGETNWRLNALRYAVRRAPQPGRRMRTRPNVIAGSRFRGGLVVGGETYATAD